MDKSRKNFAIAEESIRPLSPAIGGCFATNRTMIDGAKVGYMYREAPDFARDSGWRFLAGDESPEYVGNASNMGIYEVHTVANYDPDMIPYLNTPAPCAFEKIAGTCQYRPVDPPKGEA